MIATHLPCQKCGKVDLTGELPANNPVRLCVNCYAQSINANPKAIRYEMKQQLIRLAEQKIPKVLDKV